MHPSMFARHLPQFAEELCHNVEIFVGELGMALFPRIPDVVFELLVVDVGSCIPSLSHFF